LTTLGCATPSKLKSKVPVPWQPSEKLAMTARYQPVLVGVYVILES
jgi:hypothetical protein